MSSMFGMIVAGRLVQTDFARVSDLQFLLTIPDADNVNHIVIFLTGTTPFPDGYGGLVYFSWPEPNSPPQWQFLGHLSNQKPSAIFKIARLKGDQQGHSVAFGQQLFSHNAQIGISIEPLSSIQFQTPSTLAEPSTVSSFVEFAQKMVENLFNYASSFCITPPGYNDSYIPMSTLRNWYTNFERRLQQNPNFWKS